MKLLILIPVMLCITVATSVNFGFVTHPSYQGVTFSNNSILQTLSYPLSLGNLSSNNTPPSNQILGRQTVTFFCCRICAFSVDCKAAQIYNSTLSPSTIVCRLYNNNFCNCSQVQLVADPSFLSGSIWDKVTGSNSGKACVDTCVPPTPVLPTSTFAPTTVVPTLAPTYPPNCTVTATCFGVVNCSSVPVDCYDYAVRLGCSMHRSAEIWPWGYFGPKLNVQCWGKGTVFWWYTSGSATYKLLTSSSTAANATQAYGAFTDLNFATVSYLVKKSTKKRLCVAKDIVYEAHYDGLNITTDGRLTVASVNTMLTITSFGDGLGVPLQNVPYVNTGTATQTCGPFWYLGSGSQPANFSTCNQKTYMKYDNVTWNNSPVNALIFSFY